MSDYKVEPDDQVRAQIIEALEWVWRDGNTKQFTEGNVPIIHYTNHIIALIQSETTKARLDEIRELGKTIERVEDNNVDTGMYWYVENRTTALQQLFESER